MPEEDNGWGAIIGVAAVGLAGLAGLAIGYMLGGFSFHFM